MRVLVDRHHHALLEAWHLTLADRLGWEVWNQYGLEWFDEGLWEFEKKFHGDAVARQYLLGVWPAPVRDGVVCAVDPRHPNRAHLGVTLERAREMEWDIVISTLPANDEGMHRFATEVGARFGVQVGNNAQISRWDLADFIISSSTLDGYGPEWVGKRFDYLGKPAVMVHQEFSTDIFRYEYPPANRREVASWVNCFAEGPSYPAFLMFAREHADEFDFKVYGAYGSGAMDEFAGGDISSVEDVATRMRGARVGWHSKHWSDGFGHTIHNWFAIGRPIVGYFERYYKDKLASPLWVHGETAFDLDRTTDLIGLLRRLRDDDEYHERICENAAARFREVVDFDAEADAIKALLEA